MADIEHSLLAHYKRAASTLAVLQLLKERTMYGYEISQAMKEKSNGDFTVTVLYPVLYRLEEQGYVAVARTEVINNHPRNYYAITEEGRQYLTQAFQAYQKMHHAFLTIMEEAI